MIRITKFKKTKRDKIKIKYEVDKGNGTDEFALKSCDDPRPELDQALEDLQSSVCEICELPESDESNITVTGVSFSYMGDENVMGAVITAQKELIHTSNAPLNINTPNLPSEPYNESVEYTLPEDCVEALLDLTYECKLYIQGTRKQLNLFDGPDTGKETDNKCEADVESEVVSENYDKATV